jgi:DNA-binding MarR family transcriptional regulator
MYWPLDDRIQPLSLAFCFPVPHEYSFSASADGKNRSSAYIQLICTAWLYICHTSSMNDRVSPSPADRSAALAEALRAISGKLKRKLREQGGQSDLRPSQVSVVLRIEKDGPAAVSTLARAEGMRPQSMSAIITSLLEAGLVSGSPDPHDRRQTLISLSRKCRKLLRDGRAARQDWLTAIIQKKLSTQEQERLAFAVNLLARLIED